MITVSQIRTSAQILWTEIENARDLHPLVITKVSLPCPTEQSSDIVIDAKGLPEILREQIALKAREFAAQIFSIPCITQLHFEFHISSDATVEFTNIVNSHEDVFDKNSTITVPDFFEDFVTRITQAANAPEVGSAAPQEYTVIWYYRGDDMTAVVPAISPDQAARLYATIMDICLFQSDTFGQIHDVKILDQTAD
jgi:hypothetical protein